MFELKLLNLKNNTIFFKVFNDYLSAINFAKRCEYSKKIKLLSFIDNSYMYD